MMTGFPIRAGTALLLAVVLAGCTSSRFAGDTGLALSSRMADIDPKYRAQVVPNVTGHKAGTIVVDTNARFLYLVQKDGTARRYGVGVGRDGFRWKGTARVARKAEWPAWTPPPAMLRRRPDLPRHMEGGPNNPLGARAMYLYRGDKDTLFRIHGSNEPWTIGQAVSSGCIRMTNWDVEDLYSRIPMGARVVVL